MNARLISSLFFTLATLTALPAADWSRFRGPEGTGVDELAGLPANFTDKDFAWTAKLPGRGHSSPVAWGDEVITTAEDAAKPGVRYVIAFSAASGKELWRYEDKFTVYPQHKLNSYAASSPAVDAKGVYVTWLAKQDERHVLALDHKGKKLWEKSLGFFKEEHGGSASPVLAGELLIVPNDHSEKKDAGIYALDPKNGAVKWKCDTGATARSSFSTPLVIEVDGKKQIVVASNPVALMGIDPATGKKLWEVEHNVNGSRSVGSPVWVDGLIFASVGQGGNGQGSVAVKPGSADGKRKAETVYSPSSKIPYVPTPVAVGKRLFLLKDGGLLSCMNAANGEVLWDERVTTPVYSSPVCVGGRIICLSRTGEVATVAADDKFTLLGKSTLNEECQATPVVAGGKLIFRTATRLIALAPGPGTEVKP